MLTKMLDMAQYELLNYPHKGFGHKMSYANASLAKGMMDYYKKHLNSPESKEILDVLKRYYNRWTVGGRKITTLNEVHAGCALIDLHKITQEEKYKRGADRIANFVKTYGVDAQGALTYDSMENKNYVRVETIGEVCPFLAKYANAYGDMDAMNIAITQISNFLEYGMDEKTVLPYHGYNNENGLKMGVIGWGQAVGKLMLGMSEVLFYLESDNPNYELVRMAYRRIVDKVEAYQMEGGLYNWLLNAKEGPADTGASAMILYSIAQSLDDKILIGIHKSRMIRGVEALKACVQPDGSLPGASAEAVSINNYPILFDVYPWALGLTISLLNLLEEEVGQME